MIKVVNNGQTPAKWFRVSASTEIHAIDRRGATPELPKVRDVSGNFKVGARYDALSGGGVLMLDVNQVDPDKLQDAVSENTDQFLSQKYAANVGIAVYGRVEYETFFGEFFYF